MHLKRRTGQVQQILILGGHMAFGIPEFRMFREGCPLFPNALTVTDVGAEESRAVERT
jgi:hypothetical protein